MSSSAGQPEYRPGTDHQVWSGRWSKWRARYLLKAPNVIATISALLGVLALLDAVLPRERRRLHTITRVLPAPATAAAIAVVAVSGLLLLRVAAGLRKRKRRDWQVAIGVTSAMTIANALNEDRRIGELAITLLLLALLITARSRFTAKADPHSRWFAARVFVQFMLVAIAYGLAMVYLYPRQVEGRPALLTRLREVLLGLVGVHGDVGFKHDQFDDILHGTLFGFGLLTVVVVALLVLRPSEPIAILTGEDEVRLRELLVKQGERDSLGYFALRQDKSVVWSASGKAAITYRVVHGVALASGDPIGDPEAWPGAIAAYRALVEEYGWTPAVMGGSELGATVFKREYDLSALVLGDEAVMEVGDFTLEGRAMRGVRQACTRVARAGYEVRVRRAHEIDAAEFLELNCAAEAWRGDGVERGFSMALSRMGDPADPECVVASAYQDGVLRGLLHFVPWGAHGLSLDLMRRDRAADNGLNEFMIAQLVQASPVIGVERVSLNFAVFRDAIERGERIGAGPILRAWRGLLIFASRWWQIESLYRFNVKFRPYWEPRFISFPSARDLPRIAIAAMEAEAFIVRPHRLKRMLGRA
ncbi:MAG: phosphatidylglycerol lysyltransferase domain-containing protein [Jatrophihabitantaceae bacterium]